MEPCGNSHFICSKSVDLCSLKLSLRSIYYFLFERYQINNELLPHISYFFNFFISILCSTVLKTFDESTKIPKKPASMIG